MTASRLYAGFTRGEDGFDCRFGNSATRDQLGLELGAEGGSSLSEVA